MGAGSELLGSEAGKAVDPKNPDYNPDQNMGQQPAGISMAPYIKRYFCLINYPCGDIFINFYKFNFKIRY